MKELLISSLREELGRLMNMLHIINKLTLIIILRNQDQTYLMLLKK